MKILWLVNILLPAQCHKLGIPASQVGGWIEGLQKTLHDAETEITVCSLAPQTTDVLFFEGEDGQYAIVPDNKDKLQDFFSLVLHRVQPDVLHVFGTEMYHTLEMMKVCDPLKTLLQIQGLTTAIAQNYFLGVPHKYQKKKRLPKNLPGRIMYNEHRYFLEMGKREREALGMARHVAGHTTWDKAHTQQLAPRAEYHCFPETLRDVFYNSRQWEYETCQKHSIFLSQASYPIKGAHMLLRIMPDIVREYPNAHLYIAGPVPMYRAGIQKGWPMGAFYNYYGYLCDEIKQGGLKEYVSFVGLMNAETMRDRYLKSNVFVCPSSMENESNALSEAKILGVPSIASYVGGVTDRIVHGEDGFFYPFSEPEILLYYIKQIFEDQQLAKRLSASAFQNTHKLLNRQGTLKKVIDIYQKIALGREK